MTPCGPSGMVENTSSRPEEYSTQITRGQAKYCRGLRRVVARSAIVAQTNSVACLTFAVERLQSSPCERLGPFLAFFIGQFAANADTQEFVAFQYVQIAHEAVDPEGFVAEVRQGRGL